MRQQQVGIVVDYLGKRNLLLSKNEERVGYFYELSLQQAKQQESCHHVILVDLSFSMTSELNGIKQSLKLILKQLKKTKNQTLSILGFADKMTSYWLIQDVKSEEIDEKLNTLELTIDRLLTVVAQGEFSSALQVVIDKIKQKALENWRHQLIILTDANWESVDQSHHKQLLNSQKLMSEHQTLFSEVHFLLFREYHQYACLHQIVCSIGFGSVKEVLNQRQGLNQLRQWLKEEPIYFLIQNHHLFSMTHHHLYSYGESMMMGQTPIRVVLFDEALKLNGDFENGEGLELEPSRLNQFRLSYSMYHLRDKRIEEAAFQLSQLPHLSMYELVRNSYSSSERNQSLATILRTLSNSAFHQDIESKVEHVKEPLCLLELIQLIGQDEQTQLWWNQTSGLGAVRPSHAKNYRFEPFTDRLLKVCQIQIGSKKLSIGLKVKLEGQVENQISGLKLDAHVFRTISLLVNGEVLIEEIGCTPSRQMKIILQQEKLVKRKVTFGNQEILILNLKKLHVSNHRISESMKEEQLIQTLYEAEQLGCKRVVLKNFIHRVLSLKSSQEKKSVSQDLKLNIRRQYGISESGMYLPIAQNVCRFESLLGHYVPVIEWKIEGFKKQLELQKAYEGYMVQVNEQGNLLLNWLFQELEDVSGKRQILLDLVNLQRIAMGIQQKERIDWEQSVEKSKVQMDSRLKRNLILNGTVTVSRKQMNEMTFRQNTYQVWVNQSSVY